MSILPPKIVNEPVLFESTDPVPITYFTLLPHQQRIIKRMAQKCRGQHGMVLIHSMGSGKTISAVGIWLNFPRPMLNGQRVSKRFVIMTPPGLDTAFRKDMMDMGISASQLNDWENKGELKFISYDEVLTMNLSSVLSDAFVIADEAHNLVAMLKTWALQQKTEKYVGLIDAFESAFKVVLLSGTPLQKDWSDLTILTSLAAGYRSPANLRLPVYPTYTSQINKEYPVDWAWTTWLRQKFLNDTTFVSTVAGIGFVTAGLYLTPPSVVSLAGLTLIPRVYKRVFGPVTTTTNKTTTQMLTEAYGATAGEFKIKGGIASTAAGLIGGLWNTAAGPIPQFSIEKMGNDIARHVSYFNYEEENFHLAEKFPLSERKIIPIQFSTFQLDFYIKQSILKDVLDDMDLQLSGRLATDALDAFRLGESVSVLTNDMEHYSRMRVVGNLSEDNYYYTTIRTKPDAFGNRVYSIYPRFQDNPNPNVTNLSRGFSADGIPRTATYADNIDELLASYQETYIKHKLSQYFQRLGNQVQDIQVAVEVGKNVEKINKQATSLFDTKGLSEQQLHDQLGDLDQESEKQYSRLPSEVSIFRLHNMKLVHDKRKAGITFATNKFFEALHLLCEQRTLYHYLPIFYSNFDEYGFRLFSAFLTQLGYYHIVIDPNDDPHTRLNLIELASLPYRRLKHDQGLKYVPVKDSDDIEQRLNLDRFDGLEQEIAVPLCILLHPSIVEGLSFNLSPSIVVNESIDGYGRAEQLYARILRAIPNNVQFDFEKQMQKRITTIAQMSDNDVQKTLTQELQRYDKLNDATKELFNIREREWNPLQRYMNKLQETTTNENKILILKLQYLFATFVPPKTTMECINEGFFEENKIPENYPKIVVRENVLFKKTAVTPPTNGKYSIKLKDGNTGFVREEDVCSNDFCRSPVYYELGNDFTLKQCKKSVFILQNSFGSWKAVSKDTLKALGNKYNIEILKTAQDITLPNFLPPILDLPSLFTLDAKSEDANAFRSIAQQFSQAGDLSTTQKWISWIAGRFKSGQGPNLQMFLRYFMDVTYPTGLWDVTDTTQTNQLSATATPDEIVETNNRVIMFNWIELMKTLQHKFEEGENFCDISCEGKCDNMCSNDDKKECENNFNKVCDLWLQQGFGPTDAQIPILGTCQRLDTISNNINNKSFLYNSISASEKATNNWEKYKNAIQNMNDILDEAEHQTAEQQGPMLDAYKPSWNRKEVTQKVHQQLYNAFVSGQPVDLEQTVEDIINEQINPVTVKDDISWYQQTLKSLFGSIIFLQTPENLEQIIHSSI